MKYDKRWELIEEIGSGGQGTVHRCIDEKKFKLEETTFNELREWLTFHTSIYNPHGNQPEKRKPTNQKFRAAIKNIIAADDPKNQFAIKILHPIEIQKNKDSAIERISQEIRTMQEIRHPNLIRIEDADTDNQWYVSPYYPLGALDKQLDLYAGHLSESLSFFRNVVAAVAELHKNGVVHRDLKPHNIFLLNTETPIVGDLGLAYYLNNESRFTPQFESVGSKYWRPEWASGMRLEDVNPSFDVFSLGKIFWAILSGKSHLRLWYWDREEFSLEKQFPKTPFIYLCKDILEKTVVEDERDCLKNAGELLALIDQVQSFLTPNEPLLRQKTAKCIACGTGVYEEITDGNPNSTIRLGLNPATGTRFIISACNNCGHMQVFRLTSNGIFPPYWNENRR